MNTSVLKQDTGFNVGPNDVSSDIEVDPDEFPLSRLIQDNFQEVHKTTRVAFNRLHNGSFITHSEAVRICTDGSRIMFQDSAWILQKHE